jgi:hypothetical protein
MDGARCFLALNTTRFLETPTAVEVRIIQELTNLRRFEAIHNGMMLRKPNTEKEPNRPRSLDYVFAQRRVEGRSLGYTIIQTAPTPFTELTDLQIALLVTSKSVSCRADMAEVQ